MSPTGDKPDIAAGEIFVSLRAYAKKQGGCAYTDNVGVSRGASKAEIFLPRCRLLHRPADRNEVSFTGS